MCPPICPNRCLVVILRCHHHHHQMVPPTTLLQAILFSTAVAIPVIRHCRQTPLPTVTTHRHHRHCHRDPSWPPSPCCRLATTLKSSITASIGHIQTPPPPSNISAHHGQQQVNAIGGRGQNLMMVAVREGGAAAAASSARGGCRQRSPAPAGGNGGRG
jgi:hypothetical protein